MSYVSSTIAGYFIDKSNNESTPRALIQIIKLVYVAHGWSLALYDKPLISDKIEAWKYGPVMPSLYHLLHEKGFENNDLIRGVIIEEMAFVKPEVRVLLDKVYSEFCSLSCDELVDKMHEKDTPWHKIWEDGKGRDHAIPDSSTKEYYSKKINRDQFKRINSFSSKESAIAFLNRAGIVTADGQLKPIYKSN